MNTMKMILPALLVLLTLTACGNSESATALPETTEAGTISAPAVVTAGREPEEDYDLTNVLGSYQDWMYQGKWDQDPVGLLAEVPDQDITLYGVKEYNDHYSALLCWGDSLAEFDWPVGGPKMVEPRLWCWDVDDDGQDEAVVVDYAGGGTGVSIYELHVIEKGADGTLTDYGFPQSLWEEDTAPLLSLATVEDRAYVVLGRELVDITDMAKDEEGDVGLSAVYPGQYIYFDGNFNADWPNDSAIRFQGGVGADTRYAYVYVANVFAAVTYHDGIFTLSEFHLNSYS